MDEQTTKLHYRCRECHSTGSRGSKMWQVVLLASLNYASSIGLPPYMRACSRNDPNLNDCALKSGKEALYQFSLGESSRGLHPLDPVFVKEMIVYVPDKNGLKASFKDNYFTGLAAMQLEGLRFDLEKRLISVDALVNLNVKNNYEVNGKLLMIPITSNGDASIKLKNTTLHVRIWYDHVDGNDGKTHWHILKHDIKYEVARAYFRLENLLSDKNLGDKINKLLNELWKEVTSEVGPSICESLGNAVVDNVAVLLEQVPYDELMPE